MDKHDIKRMLRILRKDLPEPKFQCQQCGKCCGSVPLLRTEMIQIQNYITDNRLWGEVLENMKKKSKPDATPDERVSCALLRTMPDGKTQCMVYKRRPIVCRLQGMETDLPCPHNNAGYPNWKRSKYLDIYYELMNEKKTTIAEGLSLGLRAIRDRKVG